MSRARVSGGPPLPPETAAAGGSPALAETPGLRCHLRARTRRPHDRSPEIRTRVGVSSSYRANDHRAAAERAGV